MKALVIGGTGIIGNHVARYLCDQNIHVRVMSRGLTPKKNLEDLNVEIFQGDINDQTCLIQAMKGCDLVFHTAPYYPTNMFDLKGHLKRAHQSTEIFLAAIKKSKPDKVVYTSTLTTIGKPHHQGEDADETCHFDESKVPHPYFLLKKREEEAIIKAVKNENLPIVIVNPTGVFGPYELKPYELCLVPQLINRDVPAMVDCPMNTIGAFDLAKGQYLAMQKGRIGERYILGSQNTTTKVVIREICELGGVKPPAFSVPVTLALIPAFISEVWAYGVTHKPPTIPSIGLRFAQFGQHLSMKKAALELGFEAGPMDQAYFEAINWFKKIGYC